MAIKIPKRTLIIAGAYSAYMLLFYFWGITGAQFDSFVAIALLTAVFYGGLKIVEKILAGSTKGT